MFAWYKSVKTSKPEEHFKSGGLKLNEALPKYGIFGTYSGKIKPNKPLNTTKFKKRTSVLMSYVPMATENIITYYESLLINPQMSITTTALMIALFEYNRFSIRGKLSKFRPDNIKKVHETEYLMETLSHSSLKERRLNGVKVIPKEDNTEAIYLRKLMETSLWEHRRSLLAKQTFWFDPITGFDAVLNFRNTKQEFECYHCSFCNTLNGSPTDVQNARCGMCLANLYVRKEDIKGVHTDKIIITNLQLIYAQINGKNEMKNLMLNNNIANAPPTRDDILKDLGKIKDIYEYDSRSIAILPSNIDLELYNHLTDSSDVIVTRNVSKISLTPIIDSDIEVSKTFANLLCLDKLKYNDRWLGQNEGNISLYFLDNLPTTLTTLMEERVCYIIMLKTNLASFEGNWRDVGNMREYAISGYDTCSHVYTHKLGYNAMISYMIRHY